MKGDNSSADMQLIASTWREAHRGCCGLGMEGSINSSREYKFQLTIRGVASLPAQIHRRSSSNFYHVA